MFGLMLVEPPEGLPVVDRELYVRQHELYVQKDEEDPKMYEMDYDRAANEKPKHVPMDLVKKDLKEKRFHCESYLKQLCSVTPAELESKTKQRTTNLQTK
jgi:hypothetical protein